MNEEDLQGVNAEVFIQLYTLKINTMAIRLDPFT